MNNLQEAQMKCLNLAVKKTAEAINCDRRLDNLRRQKRRRDKIEELKLKAIETAGEKPSFEDFEVPEGFTLINDASFIARIGKCESCELKVENKRLTKYLEAEVYCRKCWQDDYKKLYIENRKYIDYLEDVAARLTTKISLALFELTLIGTEKTPIKKRVANILKGK